MAHSVEPGVDGFEYAAVAVGPTSYRPGIAGGGPAVLLLHGFPETHYCWHRVAPVLAGRNTVVVCDLKGVGYRMALDHPERVERLGVLNVVPTVDQFERMAAEASLDYYPGSSWPSRHRSPSAS
ncbi:MAG: alpha/beta fold hydrolase [Thermoleophilaceae bacterium]